MAEVTNELMYELLKPIQQDVSSVKMSIADVRVEMNSVRGHLVSIQQDVHNIYGILGRHEERLERIDRRLDIREFAEPQRPFDPET